MRINGVAMTKDSFSLNQNPKTGYFYLVPYAILLMSVLDILFQGRSLQNMAALLTVDVERNQFNMWLVRTVSVFIVFVSLERIRAAWRLHQHWQGSNPLLTRCFVLFWLGSVAMSMAFSAHPYFAHPYLYSLILGLGVLALTPEEAKKFILALRNALTSFIALGFIALPFAPYLVLESNYTQGYISNLPRLAGFASHAVMLGEISIFSLLLNLAYPLKRKFMRFAVNSMIIVTIIIAQAKAAWVMSFICVFLIFLYRHKSQIKDSQKPIKNMALPILGAGFLTFGVLLAFLALYGVGGFLSGSAGSQLESLTGRDVIWSKALIIWSEFPLFGYGLELFNLKHRLSISMVHATHGHNQFIDLMARSGLVGLLSILPYLIVIGVMVRKADFACKGLALTFFVALLIQCITEVPFALDGYGILFLMQVGLLAILLMSQQAPKEISLDVDDHQTSKVLG